MIGTKRITDKIINDAEADAEAKLDSAKAECEKIRADYESRAGELRERMLTEAEVEAEQRIRRAKSAAAIEKQNAILSAKSEAVCAAFDTALAEISAMKPEKYRDLLVKLIESAIINQINAEAFERENYGDEELAVGEYYEIMLNKSDRAAHGSAVIEGVRRASIGRLDMSVLEKLKLSEKTVNIDGGVVIKYGDMEINCSLSMIFSRLREELEGEVYKILFTQN